MWVGILMEIVHFQEFNKLGPKKSLKSNSLCLEPKTFLEIHMSLFCKGIAKKEILLPRGHIAMLKNIFGCLN